MRTARLAFLSVLLAVSFSVAAPAVARAQDSLRDKAKVHVDNGRALQDAEQYAEALAEYQQAYDLVPHPELLFNMAQVNRLMGEYGEAIRLYEKYLALEPDGRAADQAKEYIEESRKAQAAAEADAEAKRKAEQAAREHHGTDRDTTKPAEPTTPKEPRPDTRPDTVELDDPPPAGSSGAGKGLKVVGLVTGLVGIASVGAGIFFGLEAQRLSDELSEGTGPWTDEELSKEADGRAAERNMIIFTGVGAAAIVAGGALYFMGRNKDRAASRDLAIAPAFGSSSAAVVLTGAF